MKAACILVGTELLNGAMVDTNSVYMAEELNRYGIDLAYKLVVGDVKEDIIDALAFCRDKVDVLLCSGGLGPTLDDITKDAIASYLGKKLIVEEKEWEELQEKFAKRGLPISKMNQKEVEKPEGALSYANDVGMAPGIYVDGIAAFPGVPSELKNLFPKFLEDFCEKKKWKQEVYIKDLIVYGIPESLLEQKVAKFFDEEGVFYEFLVKDYGILIRMQTKEALKNKVEKMTKKIYNEIGNYIIGEDDDRIEKKIFQELKEKHWRLSVAESCTGGLVADKMIQLPGVSEVFQEGIVAYSNEAKKKRLGVGEDCLKNFGAVSPETAKEMLLQLPTEVAISTTGIAGPDGGTEEKPVGLVYIGVRVLDQCYVWKRQFHGSRNRIRQRVVLDALVNLFNILSKGVRNENEYRGKN